MDLHCLGMVLPVAVRASCLCGQHGIFAVRECIGVPVGTVVILVIGLVGVDTAIHPRRHMNAWVRFWSAYEPFDLSTRLAGLVCAGVSAFMLFRLWQSVLARYWLHLAR